MERSPSDKVKESKVLFVMGGPGSGKATQCRLMVNKYGLTHLSSGDLLRAQVALGTEGGRLLNRIMSHGELVPLIDVMHMVKDAMYSRVLGSPGFLIEGFPRDKEQAEKFEEELAPCHGVIFIDVPEDVMRQRLLRRGQAVDKAETILKKLNLFKERTYPVISNYHKRGLVIKINGEGTVNEVFQRVQSRLVKFRGRSSSSSSLSAIHVLNALRKNDGLDLNQGSQRATNSRAISLTDSTPEAMEGAKVPAGSGGQIEMSADRKNHHESHHPKAVNQETEHHAKPHHGAGKPPSKSPMDLVETPEKFKKPKP